MMYVVANVTAQPKGDKPSVEKKVDDKNDSNTNEDATNWQDSAGHDIGDAVPFRLKGTLPENYDDYTTYTFIFHDQQSSGLTFNQDTVVVKVDDVQISSGYRVVSTGLTDGCTFEVVFDDLKTIKNSENEAVVHSDSVITVEYTSTLNSSAKIGAEGNPNRVRLEYSNNPNAGGSGDTGMTPWDKVIVFTYQVDVDKLDGNEQPSSGAVFELFKKAPDNTSSSPSPQPMKLRLKTLL